MLPPIPFSIVFRIVITSYSIHYTKLYDGAFGQIFFTLSLGFGIMITYASYLPKKTNIGKNAFITCFVNCFYSFVAGFAVFGIVGFMAHSQGVPFEDAIKGGSYNFV